MEEEFYKDGLRFECTRCSKCCRYDPGYVFLSYSDLQLLLQGTGMEKADFMKTYCRAVLINGTYRLSLKEKSNYDCIFWNNEGCEVYEYRPLQCRSFPFWEENVKSSDRWKWVGASCPGINRGRLHPAEEIEDWIRQRQNEPHIVLGASELTLLEKEPV